MGKSETQLNADHSPHGPCFLRAPIRKLIWARLRVRLSGEMLGGYFKKLVVCQARVLMSEALLSVCDHARAQLLREQLKLSALRDAARRYQDIVCASARALKVVATTAMPTFTIGSARSSIWIGTSATQKRLVTCPAGSTVLLPSSTVNLARRSAALRLLAPAKNSNGQCSGSAIFPAPSAKTTCVTVPTC